MRFLIVLMMIASVAYGGPIGMANLGRLIEGADLIVVGAVTEGNLSGRDGSVVLQPIRFLKGATTSPTLAVNIVESDGIQTARSLKGMHGIWFLKARTSFGTYELLPVMQGSVPVEWTILPAVEQLPSSWATGKAAGPADRVFRELVALLDSGVTSTGFASEFLSQFSDESTPGLKTTYGQMLTSPKAELSAAGMAGLLRAGDVSALSALTQRATGSANGVGLRASEVQALCEFSNGNAGALMLLARIAERSQTTPQLRECAAHALRRIHSRETLPLLLKLLDADSQVVRYEAVAGLASYANSGFIPNEQSLIVDGLVQARQRAPERDAATASQFPTLDRFRREEATIVAFWRDWATRSISASR
jgi:hypothetical protein